MAGDPTAISVEYDLTNDGPERETWVTVRWGVDEDMQVSIGPTDPRSLDRVALAKAAQKALRATGEELANVRVKGA